MTPANLRRCAELLRSGEARAEIVAGEIEYAADVLDRLQDTHRLIARTEAGECWHWQGDGYDYPDSLACPVVIDHGVLRRLLRDAGRYRWLRTNVTRILLTTTLDSALNDDRLSVVKIDVPPHMRAADGNSVDAAVDAAMPGASIEQTAPPLQEGADSDSIRAAAELACGLLWMSDWRRDKAHFAFVALRDALGGPGSKGLGAAIQRAIDAGYEADHPPECDGWAGMKEFPA